MRLERKSGVTLVELLISMAIMLVVTGAIFSFYTHFLKQASKERAKTDLQRRVNAVLNMIADDVRNASFGLLDSSCSSVCVFFIDNNCNYGDETFCRSGTDRFFIGDGWRIIRDFTSDNCPDGYISDSDYDILSSDSYAASIIGATSSSVTVNTLDVDSKCQSSSTTCGDGSCEDIKARKAVIICGYTVISPTGTQCAQTGKRVCKVDKATDTLVFCRREKPFSYFSLSSARVIPANVWYVRKGHDGQYWLYRNTSRVLSGVVDFQVRVNYNGSMMDELPYNALKSRLGYFNIQIKVRYRWKNRIYTPKFSTDVEAFH